MKTKITSVTALLVSAAMFVQLGLNAQQQIPVKIQTNFKKQKLLYKNSKSLPKIKIATQQFNSFAKLNNSYSSKTLVVPIFTEDFEGVTPPALPGGWSTYTTAGGVTDLWFSGTDVEADICNYFPAPAHTQFAMSNDDACDAGGGACAGNCDKSADYLEMPSINLTGLSGYALFFESYHDASFGGVLNVEVSTDGGGVWTPIYTVPIDVANWLSNTVSLTSYDNMADVRIRFNYNDQAQWASGVAVDDIVVDVNLNNELALNSIFSTSYSLIPLTQAFPITFEGRVENSGVNSQPNVTLNANVTGAGTFSGNSTPLTLLSGVDSLLTVTTTYTPSTIGSYTVNFTVSSDSVDEDPTNNTLSSAFDVSDTVFARDNGNYTGTGFWLGAGNAYSFANAFEIAATQDVGSISFFLQGSTVAGATLKAKIYDVGLTTAIDSSAVYTVQAGDIATGFITLPLLNKPTLTPGFYFASVTSLNGATDVIFADGTDYDQPVGSTMLQDVDGAFGTAGDWYTASFTPFIRLNFVATPPLTFDVFIDNQFVSPRYFTTPLSQVSGYTFNADAINIGTDTVTNPILDIDINTGLFIDSVIAVGSLAPGDTINLSTSNLFAPSATGNYNVDYTISINETDSNFFNNTGAAMIRVSDSVYSWDSGTPEFTLGNALTSGGFVSNIYGQVFEIVDTAQLTSISFDLSGGKTGEKTFAAVYDFTGIPGDAGAQPNTMIASTDTVVISGGLENWTLPLNAVVLNPGWYYVGVHEAMPGASVMDSAVGVLVTSAEFVPNAGYIFSSASAAWDLNEDFWVGDFNYMIRANVWPFPPPSLLNAVISDSSVNGCNSANASCDGWAVVTASGGFPPYFYEWDDPSLQVSDTAWYLCAGTYTVWVWDGMGDSVSATVTITEPAKYILNITASGATTFCAVDSVELVAGSSASYNWLKDGFSTGDTTINYYALWTGNYQVVGDSAGCPDTSAIISVIVNTPPSVSVTPDPGVICAASVDSVLLTASGASNYEWLPSVGLSDSTSAIVFASPPADTLYTVIGTDTLTGCTDTFFIAVLISTVSPVSSFTADTTAGCGNITVTFNNTSTDAIGYSWDLPGGTTADTTLQNPVVTYNIPDTYDVTLTAFGCSEDSTITFADYITVNPIPTINTFIVTPFNCTPACVPICVTAAGATTYYWDFGDGIFDSTLTDTCLIHCYTNTTDSLVFYNPTIIVENVFGCTDTATTLVTVLPPVAAFFTILPDTAGCHLFTADFVNSSVGASSYQWDFGDGSPIDTTANPTHTFSNTASLVDTIYIVRLIATGPPITLCLDTATQAILVHPTPTANITATDTTTFCAGGNVEFVSDITVGNEWLQDGFPVGSDSIYYASTSGNYQVVVTNTFGCTGTSAATTVTVNPLPVISVTPDTGVICNIVDSIMLTASGAASYAWSPPTDLSATSGDTVYANPTINTTYTVVGTDTNGCVDSTTVLIQISITGAVASFTSDVTSGCGNVTVTFDGSTSTNAIGYSWSFPGGTPNASNLQNPVITYDTVGVWDVTLTAFGCSGLDSIITLAGYITIDSFPTVTFTPLLNVCDTITALTLTGGNPVGGTYSGPNVSGGNFNAQAADIGIYTIIYTYTDAVTGCTDFATQFITVDPCGAVGISELFDAANSIKLYPNPTTGVLNIEVESDIKVTSIRVYSIIGSLTYEITEGIDLNSDHYVIDLSSLPRGIYLVRIQTATQILVKKVNLNN